MLAKCCGTLPHILTVARACGFVNAGQMLKHYEQHGQDFGAKSPKEYARMAEEFLTGDTPNHVRECTRKKGDVVRFDPTTDAYGILDANGVTRTLFIRGQSMQLSKSMQERAPWNLHGRWTHRHLDDTTYFLLLPEASVDRTTVPVCGYGMEEPPEQYRTSARTCGTEFGVHDVNASIEELRVAWLRTSPKWFSSVDPEPQDWNPFLQITEAILAQGSFPGTSIRSEVTGDDPDPINGGVAAVGVMISFSDIEHEVVFV